MDGREGYRYPALGFLEKAEILVGDEVEIITDEASYKGTLMPRYESADSCHIVLKLLSGYNIGINVNNITDIKRLKAGEKPTFRKPPKPVIDLTVPKVSIISTGGTIASIVDYRTGGVRPALSAEELYFTVPELTKYAQIETQILFSIYSENITTEHWRKLSEKIAVKIREGTRGVVVTHGTDTLGYSSAALSFALQGSPVPVILVGSQRSSDRPSSDAASNLIAATVLAAKSEFAGVYVAMHSGLSDTEIAVHRGTKVRKNHTSRRDAFDSVNIAPVAYVEGEVIRENLGSLPRRGENSRDFQENPTFEPRVGYLKTHPDFNPILIDILVEKGYRGIILEGTGLGHINKPAYTSISNGIQNGVLICMTSQCIWGRVNMRVYDTGRDLLSLGVLPVSDMLPETAFVKLSWCLANAKNTKEAKKLMISNLADEYCNRSQLD